MWNCSLFVLALQKKKKKGKFLSVFNYMKDSACNELWITLCHYVNNLTLLLYKLIIKATVGWQPLCCKERKDLDQRDDLWRNLPLMNKPLHGLHIPCKHSLQSTDVFYYFYSSLHVSMRSYLVSFSLSPCLFHSLLFLFFPYQFKWYLLMNKCPNLSVSFI